MQILIFLLEVAEIEGWLGGSPQRFKLNQVVLANSRSLCLKQTLLKSLSFANRAHFRGNSFYFLSVLYVGCWNILHKHLWRIGSLESSWFANCSDGALLSLLETSLSSFISANARSLLITQAMENHVIAARLDRYGDITRYVSPFLWFSGALTSAIGADFLNGSECFWPSERLLWHAFDMRFNDLFVTN